MSLTTASIRFPVTVVVGVLLAVIGGMLALTRVPIQLTPEVQRPVINIRTVCGLIAAARSNNCTPLMPGIL